VLLALVLSLLPFGVAFAAEPFSDYAFAGPVFGMDVTNTGNLLVADSAAGIVALKRGTGEGALLAALPGLSDVASVGGPSALALTGAPDGKLYRVFLDGRVSMLADLAAFEASVNPDGGIIDSNPYKVTLASGGRALVADAAANALLIVGPDGSIDWVATLPNELVSTANIKSLAGCPNAPPELAEVCGLPEMIPAEPVSTSVAVGPDGAYYVGELKGFPFPTGVSKIWRIEPGARHAQCGMSDQCRVVADGFTSIVDLNFGDDGKLYVTEIDEASAAAVELAVFAGVPGLLQGGTVNACDPTSWNCWEVATDLTTPTASEMDGQGNLFVVDNALVLPVVMKIP
jgi:hypothetical protein